MGGSRHAGHPVQSETGLASWTTIKQALIWLYSQTYVITTSEYRFGANMRQWRLINDCPTTGAHNMAVDDAILTAVARGDAPPTLRFYDWSPPCLSLGYAQKSADADLTRLAAAGWDVVRRPTGGRAILHIDELTYSVAVPEDHPLASGGIVDSYRRISAALLAGLQRLGAQVDARPREGSLRGAGPVCFEIASHYEITVNGRKLVGS